MRVYIPMLLLVALLVSVSCVNLRPDSPTEDVADSWDFDSIHFEIAPCSSLAAVDITALEWFRERLHEFRFCGREHISFTVQSYESLPFPPLWSSYSLDAYTSRRRTTFDHDPEDRNLVVFVPYLFGNYMDGMSVRMLGGIQYGPSSFAVFKDGAGSCEPAVLLHEFGHLIGLADPDSHTNYDASHPSHCATTTCVMFWATPTAHAVFDAHCARYIRGRIVERNVGRNAKLY